MAEDLKADAVNLYETARLEGINKKCGRLRRIYPKNLKQDYWVNKK